MGGVIYKRDDLLVSRAEQGNEKNLYLPFFLPCTNLKRLTTLICEPLTDPYSCFSNMRWFPSLWFHPAPQDAPKPPSQFLYRVLPKVDWLRKAVPTWQQPWATAEKSLSFPGCPAWVCHMPRVPGLYSPKALGLAQILLPSCPKFKIHRVIPKATSTGCQLVPKAIRDLLWERTQCWGWGWTGCQHPLCSYYSDFSWSQGWLQVRKQEHSPTWLFQTLSEYISHTTLTAQRAPLEQRGLAAHHRNLGDYVKIWTAQKNYLKYFN